MVVQLQFSREVRTSAAVLLWLNYGLPVIVNANGSMAELTKKAFGVCKTSSRT